MLGGIAEEIKANKRTLVENYIDAVRDDVNKERGGKAFFWLVNLRGFYLKHVVEKHTAVLRDVHEKLVQLLETFPTAVPQPILLRRWNSALQEGFLAGYSRHVNWEVCQVLGGVLGYENSQVNDMWTAARVVHTWTHEPDSRMSSHRRYPKKAGEKDESSSQEKAGEKDESSSQEKAGGKDESSSQEKAGKKDAEDVPKEMSTIFVASAYFYLEQPNLFPLLYHEITHHHIDLQFKKSVEAGKVPKFLSRMQETYETLQKVMPREDMDAWRRLCGEIWTDAIAIAACGKSYLLALSSQMMGRSGVTRFICEEENGWPKSIAELGKYNTRNYFVDDISQQTEHELSWEARLKFCCWLLKDLVNKGQWKEEFEDHNSKKEYYKSAKKTAEIIESEIDLWWEQGKEQFDAALSSGEHALLWKHRIEANEFLLCTWREALDDCVNDLCRTNPCSTTYWAAPDVSASVAGALSKYVEGALADTKNAEKIRNEFSINVIRIEEYAQCARLKIGKTVADSVSRNLNSGANDLERKVQNFADYIRHDGSTAFRMALEAWAARSSLYENVADALLKKSEGGGVTDQLRTALGNEKLGEQDKDWLQNEKTRKEVASCLKLGKLRNAKDLLSDKDKLICGKAEQFLKDVGADEVIKQISQKLPIDGQEGIGVMTLGQFRIGHEKTEDGLLGSLLGKMSKYISAGYKAKVNCRRNDSILNKSSGDDGSSAPVFFPLIGDYDYLHYAPGVTPAERDFHLRDMPKTIGKPRLVLEIPIGAESPGDVEGLWPERENAWLGKVSLIKLPYRWQWTKLIKELEKSSRKHDESQRVRRPKPRLFLSSAWEDVVLITWHTGFSEMVVESKDLGIFHRGKFHSDSQTNLIPPWGGDCGDRLPRDEYEMLGRYDRSIFFKQATPAQDVGVKEYFKELNSEENDFWQDKAIIATGFLWRTDETDEKKVLSQTIILRMTLLTPE